MHISNFVSTCSESCHSITLWLVCQCLGQVAIDGLYNWLDVRIEHHLSIRSPSVHWPLKTPQINIG